MAVYCMTCGEKAAQDARFCGTCGAQIISPGAGTGFDNTELAAGGSTEVRPDFSKPQFVEPEAPKREGQKESSAADKMSVGDYVLSFFIASIPLVGLVMLIIWAFGDDLKRQNFAKGFLLWNVICAGIGVVFFIIFFVMAAIGSMYIGDWWYWLYA